MYAALMRRKNDSRRKGKILSCGKTNSLDMTSTTITFPLERDQSTSFSKYPKYSSIEEEINIRKGLSQSFFSFRTKSQEPIHQTSSMVLPRPLHPRHKININSIPKQIFTFSSIPKAKTPKPPMKHFVFNFYKKGKQLSVRQPAQISPSIL